MHQLIDQDKSRLKSKTVEIYLGDFVDRGSDSNGVIEMLLARARREIVVCLKGNHEIMFESYLAGQLSFDLWRPSGGLETLISYDIDATLLKHGGAALLAAVQSRIPEHHRKFLAATRSYLELGEYCFVHAGIKPKAPLEKQSLTDFTMIRRGFLDYEGSFGCIVVHGHSPHPNVEFKHNRVNIDTGAYATNKLSVIRIDENGPMTLNDR